MFSRLDIKLLMLGLATMTTIKSHLVLNLRQVPLEDSRMVPTILSLSSNPIPLQLSNLQRLSRIISNKETNSFYLSLLKMGNTHIGLKSLFRSDLNNIKNPYQTALILCYRIWIIVKAYQRTLLPKMNKLKSLKWLHKKVLKPSK